MRCPMFKRMVLLSSSIVCSLCVAMDKPAFQRPFSPFMPRTCSSPDLSRVTGSGWLLTITGPMYSGKSDELMTKVALARIGDIKVQIFKPSADTRTNSSISSRARDKEMNAISVDTNNPEVVLKYVEQEHPQVVALDEAQFFNRKMVNIVEYLTNNGLQVWAAGLNKDFKREPFGECMPELIVRSDDRITRMAVCAVCKSFFATLTQRLIHGKPASRNSPIIVVEDGAQEETYEPRCRRCHELPE